MYVQTEIDWASINRVLASFVRSLKKSRGTAAKELLISIITVWRVLGERLVFKPYRTQMVGQLSDDYHRRGLDFCSQLQDDDEHMRSKHVEA